MNSFGGVSLTSQILGRLPATAEEIASAVDATHKCVLATLYRLRDEGVVAKTNRKTETSKRGPKPAIWDRA